MNKKRKEALKKIFLKSNSAFRRAADNNKIGYWGYNYLFLPIVVGGFRFSDYKIGKMVTPAYKKDLDEQLKHYMPEIMNNRKKGNQYEEAVIFICLLSDSCRL